MFVKNKPKGSLNSSAQNSSRYLKKSLSTSELDVSHFSSSRSSRNSIIHNIIFSKERRFREPSKATENVEYYNIQKSFGKNKRAAGFGYGEKKYFTPLNTPSPNSYNIMSSFEYDRLKKKGFSLSSRNRDSISEEKASIPGPGAYKINKSFCNPKRGAIFVSRKGLYYDVLMKGKPSISPQKYNLRFTLVESGRYKNIQFGRRISNGGHVNDEFPSVGTYNLPSCFDPKYKKVFSLS